MKKAIFLVFFMTFCVWANAALAIFTDVPMQHLNAKSIEYVREQGIVKGYPDGTFKPSQLINRAEFTKIIIEAVLEKEPVEDSAKCFPDVENDIWFHSYVCFAKRTQIISGFPDGTFRPAQNISYAEAAKIVINTYDIPVGSGEPWFQPYTDGLAALNATPPTVKDPTQLITRGEMAEIIYRIMEPQKSGNQQASNEENDHSEFKQRVIDLTNEERKKAGLSPLSHNAFLESAAQAHADDMQQRDYFEHLTPEGATEGDRIKASGYLDQFNLCDCSKSYSVGENLSKGQITAEEAVQTWMDSPLHRDNLLSPNYSEIGIGITQITEENAGNFEGYFWVQNFGDVKLEK
jgi:uncharacterized protein YkwD